MIQNLFAIIALVFCMDSCAGGGKAQINSRRMDRKLWYFCEPEQISNYIGKVCSSKCLRRRSNGACKPGKLVLIYKDVTTKEGHEFFSKPNHVIVNERDLH
jgi:hypothetical protein